MTALVQAVEAAVTELAELLLSSALERVTAQLLEEAEEGSGERVQTPVEAPKPPRKASPNPPGRPMGRKTDTEARNRILAEVGRKPGSTMADIGRALGMRPDQARYQARLMADDGLLRRQGTSSETRWYLTTSASAPIDEPAPTTQRSERAPAPEAVDPEAAILAHLRKSPASLEGIRRACCPDWLEAPLGRLLHAMRGRGLVEGLRGRGGLVTWRIKGAA